MESQLKYGELHKQQFFRSVGEGFTMNFLLKKPKKERKKRKEERKKERKNENKASVWPQHGQVAVLGAFLEKCLIRELR